MASSASQSSAAAPFFFFIIIFSLTHQFHAEKFSLPEPFLLRVTKDASTSQYLTKIHESGSHPLTLVLDLNGHHLWTSHAPSTRLSVPLRSVHCLSAARPGVERSLGGSTCEVVAENGVTGIAAASELSECAVAVDSSHVASISPVHHHLLFAVSPASLLSGLASGAKGMLGLGRARTALPEQLTAASGGDRRFLLCLSESQGVAVVGGDWPYTSSPLGADVSKSMVYAPLLAGGSGSSGEYSVKLKSIEVNGERLTLNSSSMLLSTVVPYTMMETSIYRDLTGAFAKAAAAMNMTRASAPPSAPFELCFSSGSIRTTPSGPSVPEIDFVLQSEFARWRVPGRNSMVRANDEVTCLAVLDGGPEQGHGVVLGGHQLEDILMEFDLGASMVGFGRSLLMSQRSCSDFSSFGKGGEAVAGNSQIQPF